MLPLSLISACSTTLTIYSQPEGAYITQLDGAVSGVAPLTIHYNITDKFPRDQQGCFIAMGATAQWVSGASYKQDTFKLCEGKGRAYTFTVNRPQNAPNLGTDLNFAMQIQDRRVAAEQARSARSAAAWAAFASTYSASKPTTVAPSTSTYVMPSGKMMNCTTTGTITNCY